ncbi:trans-2,3-enoyl-CoA reductase family protein [Onchocerca flexuosa]|uniref:very-long-chain enoyl-CoA reductase n=1 Tax=Onchocerca flexuosa TaxID=387005 RepID=A0A238BNY8_9BILA|nr:trans-2,3-enoyl-CoA reductase family protein [Onchocerca flexuosa]
MSECSEFEQFFPEMASLAIEVFDIKKIDRSIAFLENISQDETVLSIKKRLSQQLSLPINQIALRLDVKGKNLKDDQIVQNLNLPLIDAHLYLRNLGPQIGWKTVFLLEYFGPLVIYPIFYLRPVGIYGSDASRYPMFYGVKLALICSTFHYAKRLLETQFVHRFSNATMPFRNVFKKSTVVFLIRSKVECCGVTIKLWIKLVLLRCSKMDISNLSIHLLFKNLRPPGTKIRKIPMPDANPMTLMFNFVSCPNYTYEIGAWFWFSCMTHTYFHFCGISPNGYLGKRETPQLHTRIPKLSKTAPSNYSFPSLINYSCNWLFAFYVMHEMPDETLSV